MIRCLRWLALSGLVALGFTGGLALADISTTTGGQAWTAIRADALPQLLQASFGALETRLTTAEAKTALTVAAASNRMLGSDADNAGSDYQELSVVNGYFTSAGAFHAGFIKATAASASNVLTLDLSVANAYSTTLTEAVTTLTIANPQSVTGFNQFELRVTQDSTPRSITWPAEILWPGGVAPVLSQGSGDIDYFRFTTNTGGTTWAGEVIRQDDFIVASPVVGSQVARIAYAAPAIAAINNAAGYTMIPGVTGQKIVVTGWTMRAAGSAATCTSVDLQDTNGTPVSVATVAAAALTNGTPVLQLAANSGAGFAKPLTSGAGLVIVSIGTDCTTTTAIDTTISYMYTPG